MPESKALTKLESVEQAITKPIADIAEMSQAFESIARVAFLVTPIIKTDHIMPMHSISMRAVKINTEIAPGKTSGPEVYFDKRFCSVDNKGNPVDVALGKNGLLKIMAAAGIDVIANQRVDDRSDPNYCETQVHLKMRDFDGTPRFMIASKELDFRDGASEATKWNNNVKRREPLDANALADKRRNIVSLCETKAIERGVRALLTLQQTYKKADLEQKPFVIPTLIFAPDANDPQVKAAILDRALNPETPRLYPPRREQAEFERVGAVLKDVTPPRLQHAPPTRDEKTTAAEARHHVEDENPDDREREDRDDAPPPQEEDPANLQMFEDVREQRAIIVCLCPCGCQREITEQTAKLTTEKVGAARCSACFPGEVFNYDQHKDIVDLKYPKRPGLTADDIRKMKAARDQQQQPKK